MTLESYYYILYGFSDYHIQVFIIIETPKKMHEFATNKIPFLRTQRGFSLQLYNYGFSDNHIQVFIILETPKNA
jgi:hypothetical protein